MKRMVSALGKLNWGRPAYAALVLCATTAIALPAQTFTTLFSFDGTNGICIVSCAGLVQATDGNLYGTTPYGGTNCPFGCGTIFKLTPSGTLTTLYSFCSQGVYPNCADGNAPQAALVQATNGDLYGTTEQGGSNTCLTDETNFGCGTIFKITPNGKLTTLYNFCSQGGSLCTDGANPEAGLIQATNGDFYGTTVYGGANLCDNGGEIDGCGTIFKVTPSGTLTTLYTFCSYSSIYSNCGDGDNPYVGLVQATNGDLYGTNVGGGANGNYGTIFKITPAGTLTTLYSFCSQTNCTDGAWPSAALVQATNGDFYGTAGGDGANDGGTVFKITPSGKLTTLYSFCSGGNLCTDGASPYGGLVQATNGDFYGTTLDGGANSCVIEGINPGCGTVFKITPIGTLTTLYSFDYTDGEWPTGLVQATNGDFYGTTEEGGTGDSACYAASSTGVDYGCGTGFSLSVGLGPFVKTQTTSGKVGADVKILGTNLTGATSVAFNGTAAEFTVVSPSLITTTVPAGATTGTVQVVTPNGTLSSNEPFRVLP